jgi:hypothetical protein
MLVQRKIQKKKGIMEEEILKELKQIRKKVLFL